MSYDNNEKDSEYFKRCLSLSSSYIMNVLSNNVYLLKLSKKSFKAQMKEFKEGKGIKISETFYYNLLKGKKHTCHLAYLNFFSEYWGIPLSDMLSRNFEQEDKRREEIEKGLI